MTHFVVYIDLVIPPLFHQNGRNVVIDPPHTYTTRRITEGVIKKGIQCAFLYIQQADNKP